MNTLRTLLAALALTASSWTQAADVGVSIVVSQPGVYGRIDIGRFPQPQVIVAEPVIVRPARVRYEPVYLWVPPGHQKKWSKHCHRYDACGVPVYFVRDDWYEREVMQGKPKHGPKGHGKDKGHGKGHDRD